MSSNRCRTTEWPIFIWRGTKSTRRPFTARRRPSPVESSIMTQHALADAWTDLIAPRTRDVRTELVHEAADFLGIPVAAAWERLRGAGHRFRHEWISTVGDARSESELTRFYNQSDTELFELIEWHATDPIHYRT